MSLNVSRTRLHQSMKELLARWDVARRHWDDRKSREFQERHLRPLEPKVTSAVAAMEKMEEILHRLQRECG